MSTIWIANEAGHNYEKARVFAEEIKPLTLGNVNPLQFDRLLWHIARGITKFVHEDDFLLISGTPAVSAACLVMWLLQFKKCNMLQWNASRREYELTTVERDHLENVLEREVYRG